VWLSHRRSNIRHQIHRSLRSSLTSQAKDIKASKDNTKEVKTLEHEVEKLEKRVKQLASPEGQAMRGEEMVRAGMIRPLSPNQIAVDVPDDKSQAGGHRLDLGAIVHVPHGNTEIVTNAPRRGEEGRGGGETVRSGGETARSGGETARSGEEARHATRSSGGGREIVVPSGHDIVIRAPREGAGERVQVGPLMQSLPLQCGGPSGVHR